MWILKQVAVIIAMLVFLFLLLFTVHTIISMFEDESWNSEYIYFALIIIPVSLIMLKDYIFYLFNNPKIILTKETLSFKSTFINRDLKLEEIKGYKMIEKIHSASRRIHIYVIPTDNTKKTIKIKSYFYFKNGEELGTWIESNFTRLPN